MSEIIAGSPVVSIPISLVWRLINLGLINDPIGVW